MFNERISRLRPGIPGVVFALATIGAAAAALAQSTPRSFTASPEVYKVIAQNDEYLVIEVTWKTGQRDQLHSHQTAGVYYVTDCTIRSHTPDGKTSETVRKAGTARVQAPIASHWVENAGQSDCKLVMFEPK